MVHGGQRSLPAGSGRFLPDCPGCVAVVSVAPRPPTDYPSYKNHRYLCWLTGILIPASRTFEG